MRIRGWNGGVWLAVCAFLFRVAGAVMIACHTHTLRFLDPMDAASPLHTPFLNYRLAPPPPSPPLLSIVCLHSDLSSSSLAFLFASVAIRFPHHLLSTLRENMLRYLTDEVMIRWEFTRFPLMAFLLLQISDDSSFRLRCGGSELGTTIQLGKKITF